MAGNTAPMRLAGNKPKTRTKFVAPAYRPVTTSPWNRDRKMGAVPS